MFKSILFAAALVAGATAQLTINTPTAPANEANQCQPFLISWNGGTPPYIVTVSPQTGGNAIVSFTGETGTSQSWTVNATSGESLLFSIRDSTGAGASSAPFTVGAGTGDTTCLGAGGASSPSTSDSAGSSPASSTSPAGTSPTSSAASGSSPSSAGSSGSSASKASSPSGSSSASKSAASASNSSSAGIPAARLPAGVFPAAAAVLGAIVVAVVA